MVPTPTPKDRFTALDTLAVVRELRALDRPRVDKAFDLERGGWSLVVRVPAEGRRELVLVPGRYAALLREPPARTEELSPFAKELRRLLTGATLRSVAEPGGERLLALAFSRADEPSGLLLAFEIFGSGNVLVVREGKIAAVAYPRQWAHRSVRVRAEYLPPPRRVDPWSLSPDEIRAELERSRTDLASTLAARLSLGGPIAEELIARLGGNPEEPAAPSAPNRAARLHEELARLLGDIGQRPKGFVYAKGGVVVDATPYRSARWSEDSTVTESERPTFSEAAHDYFGSLVSPPPTAEEEAASRARKELERLAKRQRRAVEELSLSAARRRGQAEAIFAYYAEAERALRKASATESAGEPVRSVEVDLGGTSVSLEVGRTPRESAQALFGEVKRLQTKLAGARSALEATERRLSVPVEPSRTAESRTAAVPERRSRTHWFERYRWFVSSEGAIVVGGRDASSNDLLVKRHLRPGDIYVHADLHGAASVVVKHSDAGGSPLTDTTYREAGQWAVAFSKAWRAGLASASAFWVTQEQVSKSGESGEFVARGAWVVRGTKNVMHDLPTELAVGQIDYGGERRWTVAPPSAIRARGIVRVLLSPGPDRDRSEREKDLARELGLSRSWLQSALPAGGLALRRP